MAAKRSTPINRRQFMARTSKSLLAAPVLLPRAGKKAGLPGGGAKVRFALVGTGDRGSGMWGERLVHPFQDEVQLVGLCDVNTGRARTAQELIGTRAPVYSSADFEQMLRETRPDAVIVTTPDCFHAEYIVRALESGCDVICEKPLVTEAGQGRHVIDAEQRTGKSVVTTFNVRFMDTAEEIKRVVASGEIGEVIAATFHEYLDIHHGASYFRRWHGKSRFSGTLLVHKASHHFDQMNWTLDADPVDVHAFGRLAFYGRNNAFRAPKCRGCPWQVKCDFYWDITKNPRYMALYVQNEQADGYMRDGCVWDRENDTYDAMSVEVRYANGVLLNYSLNAYLPYEGQRIAFNGTKGRLDVRIYARQSWDVSQAADFRLTRNFGKTRLWQLPRRTGGHGGADEKLKAMLFRPTGPDPLERTAGSRSGILASIIGIAARRSIETGERTRIRDLISLPAAWRW